MKYEEIGDKIATCFILSQARSMAHSKGCFFLEEDGNVISHQYQLSLPEDSCVHITIEPYSVKMSGGKPQFSTIYKEIL